MSKMYLFFKDEKMVFASSDKNDKNCKGLDVINVEDFDEVFEYKLIDGSLQKTKKIVDKNFKNAVDLDNKKRLFDFSRDEELKTGVVISDVFMNEDIIKTMAVQHNIATDDEVIEWIDINNQTVTFSKVDFGALIKAGSQKVKEIYFKYRALKNELEEA